MMSRICLLQVGVLALALVLAAPSLGAKDSLEDAAGRIEDRAESFSERFDKELDKLVIDGFKEEDQLEDLAERLRARLDEVHDEVKDDDNKEARKEIQRTLSIASEMNDAILEYAFSPALKDMWADIRTDLNVLARHYGLSGMGMMRSSR